MTSRSLHHTSSNNNNNDDDDQQQQQQQSSKQPKTNPSHQNVLISRLDDTLEPWQWNHRAELEEVKRRCGYTTNLLDQWIWKFLENKHFDVNETVSKLGRRLVMERDELGTYEIGDVMRETMKAGVSQWLGLDRAGRMTIYIVTARDFPKSKHRQMRTQNFDMWLSYACKIRSRDARCGITMLINQTDASVWSNTDMTFQSNIALRIAKYYPNVIDKAYVCNMSTTLSTIAKPILSAFPKAISDHIFVISKDEVKNGKLLEYFDEDVLPEVMGGKNKNYDQPANFEHFATEVEAHYGVIKQVIQSGKSLKEWEMEQALEECAKIEEEEKRKFKEQQQEQQQQQQMDAMNNNNNADGNNSLYLEDDNNNNQFQDGLLSSTKHQRKHHRRRESHESKGSKGSQQQQTTSSRNQTNVNSPDEFGESRNKSPKRNFKIEGKNNGNDEDEAQQYSEGDDSDSSESLYTCASSDVDIDGLLEEYYEKHDDKNNNNNNPNDNEFDDKNADYFFDESSTKAQKKSQRRLFDLQRRQVVRDEAYFRSTLVELYETQLRTLDEYYVQRTLEEEEHWYRDNYDFDGSDDDLFDDIFNNDDDEDDDDDDIEGEEMTTKMTNQNNNNQNNNQNCFTIRILDETLHEQQRRRRKLRRATLSKRNFGGRRIFSNNNNNNSNGGNNNNGGRGGRGGGGISASPTSASSPAGRRRITGGGSSGSKSTSGSGQQKRFSALATLLPKSFQGLAVGFLMALFVGCCAFFFMATFFYLMGCAAIIVSMFLAIFSDGNSLIAANIIPMGLGILLVSHQGALVASRGFELATQTLRGELILPFRWISQRFGKRYGVGLLMQFLLFFSIFLAMFVTFCVSAVVDPILGLQQLFAIGLYSAGVIIMLVHAFFPFGLDAEEETRQHRSKDSSRIGLSVYFFFDIYENLDEEQAQYNADGQREIGRNGDLATSSLVLAMFPTLMSFALGLSFIMEQSAFFLISSVVITVAAAFTLTHFIAGRLKTLTANMSRSAIWMGTLIWIYFFWSFGLLPAARDLDVPYHANWIAALIGLFVYWALIAFFSSAANRASEATKSHRFFFRAGYAMIGIAIVAGVVLLFIVNWVLGLFSLLFLLHSVACFYRHGSHSPTAMLILSVIVCLVLVAIILFAANSGSQDFHMNKLHVLRNGNASSLFGNESTLFSSYYNADSSQNDYQSEAFSLCQRVWHLAGSSVNLRLPDFAFFSKLAYAQDLTPAAFKAILPQWTLKVHGHPVGTSKLQQYLLFDAFQDVNNNTIVAVRSRTDLLALIKVVSMWTEAISLLPFVSILPVAWTASVVGGVADVSNLFDPFGKSVIDELQNEISAMMAAQEVELAGISAATTSTSAAMTTSTTSTASGAATGASTTSPSTIAPNATTWVRTSTAIPANTIASSLDGKREFILIGHSVAGSVAAAVATRLGLRAVTFSSPGLQYSKLKFNIDASTFEKVVLNIRTSNDAVSVVDSYGQNQQTLPCHKAVGDCSSIDFTLCTLSSLCGTSDGGANISLSIC